MSDTDPTRSLNEAWVLDWPELIPEPGAAGGA